MSGIVAALKLWAAQEALKVALAEQPELADAATGLGHPVNVEPDHVWIAGGATGSLVTEMSGDTAPSDETFRLTVVVFTQLADEYDEVRDRLMGLAAGAEGALSSAGFAAVVPAWTIPDFRLEEGTDGTYRQMSLELIVECRCW